MPSSRIRVAEIITPMLPDGWRDRLVRHTVKSMPTLDTSRVFIDYTGMNHVGMPAGSFVDEYEIALVSHLTDYAKAEDALDEAASHLVRQIDASTEISWSTASKRALGEYLGWVVTVQLINNQE